MGSQIEWGPLLERAWKARERAYAPYSGFRVGAALLAQSGEVFPGCNVENASLGLTICAERAAMASAIEAGQREFTGIAIVADTKTPVAPCGACRQVLAEFQPVMAICSAGGTGAPQIWSLETLFPVPFKNFSFERGEA